MVENGWITFHMSDNLTLERTLNLDVKVRISSRENKAVVLKKNIYKAQL